MEFKKSYSLKVFPDSKYLYRIVIKFKNGKVKKYRKCLYYNETLKEIYLRVLDKKGYEINIIKQKYYIKDITVDISGLAWNYGYGQYFNRRIFNEIYYYD